MADLSLNLCGVHFKNPVIAASGTFGFGREYDELYDISKLGGISVKGLCLGGRNGNPPARLAETPSGMLNAVGLQNPGIESFIENDLPWLLEKDVNVIANFFGTSIDTYCKAAEAFANTGVHMLEMNISCPNVHDGGVAFGVKPEGVYEITKAVKAHSKQPLIVKLSPNVADITENALAAQEAGADAISLINTITGMKIDIERQSLVLANKTGGLSGPAIKPVAVRMVWQAAQAVSIPVIGMGGIATAEDAIEFMMAGASAIAVGAMNFHDPCTTVRIVKGMEEWCASHGIERAADLTGIVHS